MIGGLIMMDLLFLFWEGCKECQGVLRQKIARLELKKKKLNLFKNVIQYF